MNTASQRYRINEKEVSANLIDGEAIIINHVTGMYYSLEQTGAAIWQLLGDGHNTQECVDLIARRHGVSTDQVEKDASQLVADLLEHRLMVAADRGAPTATPELSIDTSIAYSAPSLNVYDDMGDILALDPPIPVVGDA